MSKVKRPTGSQDLQKEFRTLLPNVQIYHGRRRLTRQAIDRIRYCLKKLAQYPEKIVPSDVGQIEIRPTNIWMVGGFGTSKPENNAWWRKFSWDSHGRSRTHEMGRSRQVFVVIAQ